MLKLIATLSTIAVSVIVASGMAAPIRPGTYEKYVIEVPTQLQDWGIRIIVTGAIQETPFFYNQRYPSRDACEDALRDPQVLASIEAFKAANPGFDVSAPACVVLPSA